MEKQKNREKLLKKGIIFGAIGIGLTGIGYFLRKVFINHAENFGPYHFQDILKKIPTGRRKTPDSSEN
ncbi:MAG TPA: hypothetical protein VF189_05480 [Patescibacteria group bacterium]